MSTTSPDIAATERIWQILTDIRHKLDDPSLSIEALHAAQSHPLRQACEELGVDGFRSGVPRARKHPVLAKLHEAPFLDHSFRRPRGYPGDAELLEFIYGVGEASDKIGATTPWGQRMARVSHSALPKLARVSLSRHVGSKGA